MSSPHGAASGQPHVAIFPNAGMGHLMPYLRLAATLLGSRCRVTLITACPTLTTAESALITSFLSTYPEASHLELHLLPDESGPDPVSGDPYSLQFARISRSAHLIRPMLSSASPALSAVVSDLLAASQIAPILKDLGLPLYILSTSSAKFTALLAVLHNLSSEPSTFNQSLPVVDLPGLPPLPIKSIPPPFFNPNHVFTQTLVTNSRALPQAKGILMNTFEEFEHPTLSALTHSRIIQDFPPILPIGPLGPYRKPVETPKCGYQEWLESQPVDSVVYVCFGSKAPMDEAQIQELGKGLARSGFRFLWALKAKPLTDKTDDDQTRSEAVRELLGDSVCGEIGRRGMVISRWVDQDEVLASPAVGGFVSHCGWNSVMEAVRAGVPVLAWPQSGDQRVNAQVVEESGIGIWMKGWGMGSGNDLVKGEEIGDEIGKFMTDEKLRDRARRIGEAARKAVGVGGSSHETFTAVFRSLVFEK